MSTETRVRNGADARELPACDLVMKGGITSGIVYPGLVKELAREYRFANIGGSSAGAIAAALCAAAEFGRQTGRGRGMDTLDAAVKDLSDPAKLFGLFQPTPDTRPMFDVLTGALLAKGSKRKPVVSRVKRIRIAAVGAGRARPAVPLIGLVLLAALVGLTTVAAYALFSGFFAVAVAVVAALALLAVAVVITVVVAFGLLLRRTQRSLGDSDYGFCPGTRQAGARQDAVVEWLHEQIQRCAGRTTEDAPLTFRELDDHGIRLTMLTTDLGFARPVRVPEDIGRYRFDEREMCCRLPDTVVAAMLAARSQDDGPYKKMPDEDLPIVVGVRLSLSFPILMSAMPLWWIDDAGSEPRRHLLSDGGIGSNFPVHFFDSWFPRRPTFAIDLARYPDDGTGDVFMLPDPREPAIPRWQPVDSLFAFLGDIKDTMQNWRDTMQSELPGFRDRVCQIRFEPGQGGLHLNMEEADITTLVKRGRQAGREILRTFTDQHWEQHRYVRYLTLMAQLQDNLHRARQPYEEFAPRLEQGLPCVGVYREGRDGAWCARAAQATAGILALGDQWGPPPLGIDLDGMGGPMPRPVMRIVPRA